MLLGVDLGSPEPIVPLALGGSGACLLPAALMLQISKRKFIKKLFIRNFKKLFKFLQVWFGLK